MSGVFANRFGRKYSRTGVCVNSVKYSTISSFAFRQVKYEYDCEKPTLARYFITFGRVNASERKIVSGYCRFSSVSTHSQNRNGLVCGLSTRKIVTPCSIQNSNTRFNSCQSARQSADSKLSG